MMSVNDKLFTINLQELNLNSNFKLVFINLINNLLNK